MEAFRKIYPAEFYRKFLVHNLRPDGRPLQKVRKTKISTGSISTADGSSFVKLGHTSVVAGAKGEMGPATDMSKDGQIVINVELTPICSTKFRPGKPSEQAQAIGQFLNDLIRTSNCVSFNGISLDFEGKKIVWYIYVDIYCLNYDGNVLDACLIAVLAALTNVRLPTVKVTDAGVLEVVPDAPLLPLKILHYPIPLTFAMFDDFILTDPTSEEEELQTGSFTIVYNNEGKLCSLMKPGGASLSEDTLKECMVQAQKRTSEVVLSIQQAVSNKPTNGK